MANDIDKTSPHYKGDFGSIYEVNKKFPTGGVAGDFVVIEGWAHYWNADRGTWCVNSQRDTYWDELFSGVKFNTENIMKKYEHLLFDLSKKANTSDVQASLEELKKEIGDRTVVEGNVTNLPDEEDITSGINESGTDVLSLKDRVYNPLSFSGKGYKILRKNIKPVSLAVTKIIVGSIPTVDGAMVFTINGVEVSVDMVTTAMTSTDLVAQKIAEKLTETMTEYEVSKDASTITLTRKFGGSVTPSVFSASTTGIVCTVTDSTKKELRNILTPIMMNQPNTIYEIRYDFDLNGETIEMQEGCTFKFEGGSLCNGKIVGNNTGIKSTIIKIFENISFDGNFINICSFPEWFGEYGLWENTHELFCLSRCIKLTKPTYKSPLNPRTIYIEGQLFSENTSTIEVYAPYDGFVAVQLGNKDLPMTQRMHDLEIRNINIDILKNKDINLKKTACLGIGSINRSSISRAKIVNHNFNNSELTEEVLNNPDEYLNYGIKFNGFCECMSLYDIDATADITVFFEKEKCDYIGFYGGSYIAEKYGYGSFYGQGVSNFLCSNVSFDQGIRPIHFKSAKRYSCCYTIINGRFEQVRPSKYTINLFFDESDNQDINEYVNNVNLLNCEFYNNTIFKGITKQKTNITFIGCRNMTSYESTMTIFDTSECKYISLRTINCCFETYGIIKKAKEQFLIGYNERKITENMYYKNMGNILICRYESGAFPTTSILTSDRDPAIIEGSIYLNTEENKIKLCSNGAYKDLNIALTNGTFSNKPKQPCIGSQYFNIDTHKIITWDGSKWWNPDGTEATS